VNEAPRSTASERPLVLVVDFLRFDSRPPLTRLLAGGNRFELNSVDPVSDLAGGLPVHDLPTLAAQYVGSLAARPQVVVGFCNAVTLAGEIALQLGAEVPCVAVNPTWTSADVVQQEFANLRKAAGGAESASPLPDRQRMAELLTADLMAGLATAGADPEEAEETVALLLPRQLAWLDFLRWSAEHEQRTAQATTVVSDEPVDRPAWWQGAWAPIEAPPMPADATGRSGFVEQVEIAIAAC
jgi:hypothetical protein